MFHGDLFRRTIELCGLLIHILRASVSPAAAGVDPSLATPAAEVNMLKTNPHITEFVGHDPNRRVVILCCRTPKLSSGGLLGRILGKPIKGPPSAAAICSAFL